MSSRVGIADLKARLSQHLRKVREGRTLTVFDRDTPVARIVPCDSEAPIEVRRATRRPSDLSLPSPPSPADRQPVRPAAGSRGKVIACLDTSALLRLVLREPGRLEELRSCEALVASELMAVESLRTIDRLRLQGALSMDEAASSRAVVDEWLEAVDLVHLQPPILARASDSFPPRLGTLDALHLATVLVWRERTKQTLVLATHDEGLALAAGPSGSRSGEPGPAAPARPSR